jgi:uncharacterized protein
MDVQLLTGENGSRTHVLVFDTGETVVDTLRTWAGRQGIAAASFTGIGAFQNVLLGYFDIERREYVRIPLDEQVELLSLVGNVAVAGDETKVHAHVVVGRRDGTAHGGHLLEARVRPTLELVLAQTATPLRRRIDEATGLPLLDIGS